LVCVAGSVLHPTRAAPYACAQPQRCSMGSRWHVACRVRRRPGKKCDAGQPPTQRSCTSFTAWVTRAACSGNWGGATSRILQQGRIFGFWIFGILFFGWVLHFGCKAPAASARRTSRWAPAPAKKPAPLDLCVPLTRHSWQPAAHKPWPLSLKERGAAVGARLPRCRDSSTCPRAIRPGWTGEQDRSFRSAHKLASLTQLYRVCVHVPRAQDCADHPGPSSPLERRDPAPRRCS
jgi:hypothetical protein